MQHFKTENHRVYNTRQLCWQELSSICIVGETGCSTTFCPWNASGWPSLHTRFHWTSFQSARLVSPVHHVTVTLHKTSLLSHRFPAGRNRCTVSTGFLK